MLYNEFGWEAFMVATQIVVALMVLAFIVFGNVK